MVQPPVAHIGVEILQTISEFPAKQKPGQSSQIDPTTSDLIELLTFHEEAILKHIYDEVDWQNEKQAIGYQFLDDLYHKLDAARNIRMPVHVPHMFSCTLLGMATDTTATLKGEDKALHTEIRSGRRSTRATDFEPATRSSPITRRSRSAF